ncbi:hypothetical protein FOA52_009734 [Chlamydomonas sp. UWO 241]|nr:hypothetical protein FOA52_009734 [Chlamydomonas sp. UWO 241]
MNAVKLSSGRSMPQLAFGAGTAWFKREGAAPLNMELVASVKAALSAGMRHLDLAEMYGTDREVGVALKEAGLPREQLFVTSKLLASLPDVHGKMTSMIDELGVQYLDLLLIHAPFLPEGAKGKLAQVWADMEALVESGRVHSIGVSNFSVEDLKELLAVARIKPCLNQVEFHPYLQQPELQDFCRQHGIVLAGYSGLMSLTHQRGGPVDAVVQRIASERGLSQAQVLLMWGLQQGVVVVTTSGKRERLDEYVAAASAAAGDAPLTDTDVAAISAAGATTDFRKFWRGEFGLPDLPACAALRASRVLNAV